MPPVSVGTIRWKEVAVANLRGARPPQVGAQTRKTGKFSNGTFGENTSGTNSKRRGRKKATGSRAPLLTVAVQAMRLNGLSESTVSKLCKGIDERVGEFLNLRLSGELSRRNPSDGRLETGVGVADH